jgi:perosamine synthetase
VAVCNGTAAIDAAVEALGIGAGDEVILPAFTIISCIGQIVRAGAVPVLVDGDPTTWNMDVRRIEARIGPRTRAVLAVHTYGLTVDMAPLLELCRRRGLKLIEDAAEAHGQTYHGQACGSFGDISTFSFYPNKHVTTGEGGMILTDDDDLAEQCRSLRNLCFQPQQRFVHERLGWNMRMTNLQAAVGLAQLERLDEFIARKRAMGQRYMQRLASVPGIELPARSAVGCDNHYWVFGVVLDDSVALDARQAMARLGSLGIGTRPFFCPMHLQPVLRRMGLFKGETYPVAERLWQRGFYLPSGLAVKEVQIDQAADALKEILA